MRKMLLTVVAGAGFACAFAEVKLAAPFADGMVLQRDAKTAVWGTADAGERVTVSFAGQSVSATADAEGRWLVRLAPMAASKEGRTLRANGVEVKDVLVGEVWFCCGQSNTDMPLVFGNPHYRDREGILLAGITNLKTVRCVFASDYMGSATPRREATYPVAWRPFTPENLGNPPSFSAMGVYFAIALHNALDVPIGIVGSYCGGSNIDAWTPRAGYVGAPESIRETAEFPVVEMNAWTNTMARGPIFNAMQQPTVLWNEMVEPWCPMTMKGLIWYQGCTNRNEPERYCDKMHALYKGWSAKFENPGLKLYFVQLAPWSQDITGIQLAQAKFAAEEPNAGMVVTADIGNNCDIHPADKGPIGRRLAALALRRDYGFDSLVADSPTIREVHADGDSLVLSFDNAEGWYVYNADWGASVPFEVAGADGDFRPARLVNLNDGTREAIAYKTTGVVKGRELILKSDAVSAPRRVRYLFQRPWTGNVFSSAGLPLGPFEASVDDYSGRRGFVYIAEAVPDVIQEIRYYSTYNFVGDRIDGYERPCALITREAAVALKAASDDCVRRGYRLKVYDAYRPQRAVSHFMRWAKDTADTRMKAPFYPNLDKSVLFAQGYIAEKSGHSRGSTVDLTLFDAKTGKEVDMGGTFDWFGAESHPDYKGVTQQQFANRMLLREIMLAHGFKPLAEEWWHFTLANEPYPDTYFDFPVK